MIAEDTIVWMRCPYTADMCGADATMITGTFENLDAFPQGGWAAVIECTNGHKFTVSQEADRARN